MDNKTIKRHRANLDHLWKSYCNTSRHLESLNSRVRHVKSVRIEWLRDYYAPTWLRYQELAEKLAQEATNAANSR